jgi:hypothetical protein
VCNAGAVQAVDLLLCDEDSVSRIQRGVDAIDPGVSWALQHTRFMLRASNAGNTAMDTYKAF